jgi:hypothetical protein
MVRLRRKSYRQGRNRVRLSGSKGAGTKIIQSKGKCRTGQPTDSGKSAAKAMEKRRKLGFMEAFLCYQSALGLRQTPPSATTNGRNP